MPNPEPSGTRPGPIPVCAIGASAGGIEALQAFFGALPTDLGLAYVVVLHLSPDHKSELPGILARRTDMPVVQVGDHEMLPLAHDSVYVIAPDRRLELTDSSIASASFEQPRGQRMAIDFIFRSLARARGDGFAVVLSGSGSDGALGARAVKENGGLVLVQDPDDAGHPEMPASVIAAGLADVVLPVAQLAVRLAELIRATSPLLPLLRAAEQGPIPDSDEHALRSALELLRRRTGHDFSRYKRATVLRRLSRRMQLAHCATLGEYVQYLRTQRTEPQALFHDLLISVTSFFRDHEYWDALQTQVIVPLVDSTEVGCPIRVWIPACATGEEAYSMAMLFAEEFEKRGVQHNLIIFASDVDEAALSVARAGRYARNIQSDVSDERLARYFKADDDHFRVLGTLRDRVVFANHNLLRDPPFSRMNLISCRNLLIYLDRELQEQVMRVFRYACTDRAHLFLGASENADDDLFEAFDKKHRIFTARPLAEIGRRPLPEVLVGPEPHTLRVVRDGRERREEHGGGDAREGRRPSAGEMHIAALEDAAPPSVLLDEGGSVLHLSPSVGAYLHQAGGPPARRIMELVRPELRDELYALLHRAAESNEACLSGFVRLALENGQRRVVMVARQRPRTSGGRLQTLVSFLDVGEADGAPPTADHEPTLELVRDLREKLRQAEQRIGSMRDDHYLTNEDLRAVNEELQSLNEEYRSATEELETSKEELQSINEELQTVNSELKGKLEEVSRAHSDIWRT